MKQQLLLVGCGRWGANILRDLLQLGTSVCIVDPSADRRDFAMSAGASSAHRHIASISSADGVVIATPATLHAQSIREALRFGCPLFVEKPFVTSGADARDAIRDDIFVMDKWRYHAGVEELRRIAQTQELGRVLSLQTRRVQNFDTHADVDAIWTLAPHDLAIAHEILGTMPSPLAAVGERCGERAGLVGFLRGSCGTDTPAGAGPHGQECPCHISIVIETSACRRRKERRVLLECERGTATLMNDEQIVVETNEHTEQRIVRGDPPLLRELAAFIGHLDGGEPPRGRAADAAAIVETIERLREMAGFSA